MSIHSVVLKFLLASNELERLTGTFLSIGRQTVYVDRVKLARILEAYGIRVPDGHDRGTNGSVDSFTRNAAGGLRDDALLSMVADVDYKCLDKSDYEGADGDLDLNSASFPAIHQSRYDYIYDGGTLDNVFSPAQAVQTIARMLAPRGRVLHFDVAGAWPGAYCSFSCEWFFSFYAANKFEDVRVYLAVPDEGGDGWPDPQFRLYSYSPFFNRRPGYDPLVATRTAIPAGAFVLCTARRGPQSTFDQIPTQSHYLEPGELDWRNQYREYAKLPRFPLRFDEGRPVVWTPSDVSRPLCSDHYTYEGIL